MSGLAATTRHAMALLALLFAMLAGGGVASATDREQAAATLAAGLVEGSLERLAEPSGDRQSHDGADDDGALAGPLTASRAACARPGPTSGKTATPRRDLAAAYQARAPPPA